MSSRTIFTDFFRASYVHLDVPHTVDPKDDPKYSLEALFPMSGQHQLPQLSYPIPTNIDKITNALREVILEQWAFDIAPHMTSPGSFTQVCKQFLGVNLPPQIKGG